MSIRDKIGICVHLNYYNTPYSDFNHVMRALFHLGIKHIRDGSNDQAFFNKIISLGQNGIKTTLLIDSRDGWIPETVPDRIAPMIPYLDAISPPNETDLRQDYNPSNKPLTYPLGLKEWHLRLYTALKKDDRTKNIPILAPSIGMVFDSDKLGLIPCDRGNGHIYFGNNSPNVDTGDFRWRWIEQIRKVCGTNPIVITETGYQTSSTGISEQLQMEYLIKSLYQLLAEKAFERIFIYELIDEQIINTQESRYGLLGNDWRHKPSFDALYEFLKC